MNKYQIYINFSKINSHEALIECLSDCWLAKENDEVLFTVNLNCKMLYSDYLLLVATTVNSLRESKVIVKGDFEKFDESSNQTKYASRINFFKHIGFEFDEDFVRHKSIGRFTEIKEFKELNSLEVYEEVMFVLLKNETNNSLLAVLNYCLWEVIDNALNHSSGEFEYGKGKGYISSQYFKNKKEVRILIADNGVGIHHALTKHPDSEYSSYSEKEAVLNCIEKGITNSMGKGFGLWATSEMLKSNKGVLSIHSGDHKLDCQRTKKIKQAPHWKGTYIFLKINTDNSVDEGKIFGGNYDLNESLEEIKAKFDKIFTELW